MRAKGRRTLEREEERIDPGLPVLRGAEAGAGFGEAGGMRHVRVRPRGDGAAPGPVAGRRAGRRPFDRLCIRFTPGERAWLEERAAWLDCTVSSLVRRVLFSEKVFQPVVIDAGALRKAWLELHYQGVNLNELMAHLNTCKGEADARDVEGVLAKVDRQMDRLDGIMDDLERQKRVAFGKARGGGRR